MKLICFGLIVLIVAIVFILVITSGDVIGGEDIGQ